MEVKFDVSLQNPLVPRNPVILRTRQFIFRKMIGVHVE